MTGLIYAVAALVGGWVVERDAPTLADRPVVLGLIAFVLGAATSFFVTARPRPLNALDWRRAAGAVGFLVALFLGRIELTRLVPQAVALALAAAATVPVLAMLFWLGERLARRNPPDTQRPN